jgi:hypothetical protein
VIEGIDDSIEQIILEGRRDIALWAAKGFGVFFHDKQLYLLEELEDEEVAIVVLFGANRAGKTLPIIFKHLHLNFYKHGLPEPHTEYEHKLWVAEDYRTLHAAPTNGLVGKHWAYAGELIKGTHPAQRTQSGARREAPLGAMFTAGSESVGGAGEHLVIKCLTGGTVDMYSTEGDATRIESMPWRFGTWDEWPLQEAADKGTAIRTVLNRLTTRLSDFDGKLVLTGTLTPETEHIGRDFLAKAQDPANPDWKAVQMSRFDNPYASRKAMELAERNMDEEDYKRIVLGEIGGVKGRLFPAYMVEPAFTKELPKFSPPHPEDGAMFQPGPELPGIESDNHEERRARGRWQSRGTSPYTYIHLWDLAIAVADNVGLVLRLPADYRFSVENPIVGVRRVVVPGSRTLTSAEILHTIEETFLPYGGLIVVDATDAHGKNIFRELRRAGYPVEAFVFNERDRRKVIRKDAAILNARELLTEGMVLSTDAAGEPRHDPDGVPIFDRETPFGVIRLPREWTRTRDQLSVLREDDDKQVKDEAMALLMGADTAYRARRSRTRQATNQRFAVFAGARRYGAH